MGMRTVRAQEECQTFVSGRFYCGLWGENLKGLILG